MNTERPHDILSETELAELPPELQQRYRPIPRDKVRGLQLMSEESRARWLETHPLTDGERVLIAKAEAKRARKAARREGLR